MESRLYSLGRCCQRSSMLQAIGLSFNKTPLHFVVPRTPLNCHSKKCWTSLVLISGHQTANTNPVDYKVWSVMQQIVYERRMNSIDELKQRLVEVWHSLQQNVIDVAINEWRKQLRACVHADRQHFERLM